MRVALRLIVIFGFLPGMARTQCSIDSSHLEFPYSKAALVARNAFVESVCSDSNTELIDLTDPTLKGRLERPSKAVRIDARDPYPVEARRYGYEGKPVVAYVLDASGAVGKAVVIETSGNRILDQAAMASVKQWRYSRPAALDGKPIRALVYSPVIFTLRGRLR